MTPELIVVIVVIAVILFVALGAAAREQDRRYRSGLRDWAAARGWAYCGNGGEWTRSCTAGSWPRYCPGATGGGE